MVVIFARFVRLFFGGIDLAPVELLEDMICHPCPTRVAGAVATYRQR
jgi:hypothetical protein